MYNRGRDDADPYNPNFPPPPTLSSPHHRFNNYDAAAAAAEEEEEEERRPPAYPSAYPPAPPPTPQDFWQQQQQQQPPHFTGDYVVEAERRQTHHYPSLDHQQHHGLQEHLYPHHEVQQQQSALYYPPRPEYYDARPGLEHTSAPPPPHDVIHRPSSHGEHHQHSSSHHPQADPYEAGIARNEPLPGAAYPSMHQVQRPGAQYPEYPGPYGGAATHHTSPYAHHEPSHRPGMELPFPPPHHHHSTGMHVIPGQIVTIHCKANPAFHVAVRPQQGVVMVPANPYDPYQLWIKDATMSTRVKDSTGSPAFALINKATGQALRHAHEDNEQVLLAEYEMGLRDETTLWSQSEDMGDGYRCIRMVNKITSNLDALRGDEKSRGIKDGTPLILFKWKKQENQIWKLTPA